MLLLRYWYWLLSDRLPLLLRRHRRKQRKLVSYSLEQNALATHTGPLDTGVNVHQEPLVR